MKKILSMRSNPTGFCASTAKELNPAKRKKQSDAVGFASHFVKFSSTLIDIQVFNNQNEGLYLLSFQTANTA